MNFVASVCPRFPTTTTNMSRLPRLHSSPLSKASENTIPMPPGPTLKRKAAHDPDDDLDLEATDQPRKLPAIAVAGRPLREIRTRTNAVSKLGVGPRR